MKRVRSAHLWVTLLLLLAGSLLAPGLLTGCGTAAEPDPFAALRGSTKDYLGPFKGGAGLKVYTESAVGKPQGYLRGDVVLLQGKRLSDFHSHLPRSLRATTPDRVGTVIIIKESWRTIGEYSNGIPADVAVWGITVVDLVRGKVVGRARFEGDEPPLVAGVGQTDGDPPWTEFRAYLRKLPRRK